MSTEATSRTVRRTLQGPEIGGFGLLALTEHQERALRSAIADLADEVKRPCVDCGATWPSIAGGAGGLESDPDSVSKVGLIHVGDRAEAAL